MIALQKKLTPQDAACQIATHTHSTGDAVALRVELCLDGHVIIDMPNRSMNEHPDLYIKPYFYEDEVQIEFQGRVSMCRWDLLERSLKGMFKTAIAKVKDLIS